MNLPSVRKTGGHIDDMVMSLIEAANDRDDGVQNVIGTSLINIGKRQPILMLSSCNFYLANHHHLVKQHKLLLLKSMEVVIKDTLNLVTEDVSIEIICQAFKELTCAKESSEECLIASSDVIVALHFKFYHAVMNELLDKFQPSVMPTYFVVQTLAKLALVNVPGTIPYFKTCLSACLTMLNTRSDNMKCVLSMMLANFSEAVVEYQSNLDETSDHNLTKEYFYEEFMAIWNIIYSTWLGSRDIKVKCAAIDCLGYMSFVIPQSHLQECLPKLLPAIYSLYKKHQETDILSKALRHVIEASLVNSSIIEPFVDSLLGVLFYQACLVVDLSSISSVKNHNEILKCFSVLGKNFPERVISFILGKLEPLNEKSRIGGLDVIQHLVNYSSDSFKDKEELILSSLKLVTCDTNNKVKRKLAEVIIGISHHGYLELEGGRSLVDFIIKQCLLTSNGGRADRIKKSDADVSNDALRLFSEHVLHHLSSLPNTSDILWPYLLTFLMSDSFTEACGVICKTITVIATRKLENNDPDYYIDFEREVNYSRPSALFGRLIILLRYPFKSIDRGVHIVDALISLNMLIRPTDSQWKINLEMLKTAILNPKDYDDNKWENQLLEFLSNCTEEVKADDWPTMCGEDLIKQVSLYVNCPEEKNFLLRCIGVVSSKSCKSDFVIQAVVTLFSITEHAIESEREACAKAIGNASSSHTELVVNKLNDINKSMKTSFIVSFFKEVIGDVDEKMKATLILSYGYVAFCSPVKFLQDQLESSMLAIVTQHISTSKDITVRNSVVRMMQLIGDAASKHKEVSVISPSCSAILFGHLKNLMKQESQTTLSNSTRSLILRASSALINSSSIEATNETSDTFSLMISRVVPLPPEPIVTSTGTLTVDEQFRYSNLLLICLEDLQHYACILISRNTTPDMFLIIFNVLQPLIVSTHFYQRSRSLQIFCGVNDIFYKNINVALVNQMPNLGLVIGIIVPHCLDQLITARLSALECIEKLLRISLRYEGRSPDFKDDEIDRIAMLKDRITKIDSVAMFAAISDLSKILNKKINGDHLFSYVEGLLEGLTDLQPHCSSAAGLALTNCIKTRGSEFYGVVEKVYVAIVQKVPEIKNPQTKTSSLRAIRFLTFHHLLKVVGLLLEEPIPFSDFIKEIWKSLGQDLQTIPSIIDYLLDTLARSQPYEEHSDNKGKEKPLRRAFPLPLAIMCALTELMKCDECHVIVLQSYPQLLTQLLVQISSMTSVRSPKASSKLQKNTYKSNNVTTSSVSISPVHISIESLKQLLLACKHEGLLNALDITEVWQMMAMDQQHYLVEGLTIFARCLVQHQSDLLPKLINILNPYISSLYPPQRIMAATLFAEFIQAKCNDDFVMVDLLVNCLIGRLVDTNPIVRRLCMTGLGNISSCGQVMVQKYGSILLPALMAGLDDKDDTYEIISLEAMKGLSKVLKELREPDVRNVLITIALRIRPFFEKEKSEMREASLNLFGNLALFGLGEQKESFLEQVYSNLVTIVLHLNDSHSNVQLASIYSLKKVGPLFESERINKLLHDYEQSEDLSKYSLFLKQLSKSLAEDISEKLNYFVMGNLTYFKSFCPKIRGNAATFAGYLLENVTDDKLFCISKEQTCQALVSLLKDDNVQVRLRSAQAISLLYNI